MLAYVLGFFTGDLAAEFFNLHRGSISKRRRGSNALPQIPSTFFLETSRPRIRRPFRPLNGFILN